MNIEVEKQLKELAKMAVESLISEAELSPKPGLVDAYNNGSHTDMDIDLFITSAKSFETGFYDYLSYGYHHLGNEKQLLKKIRPIGKKIEKTMFIATKGVNTHKGANFTFGLILSAMGRYLASNNIDYFRAEDMVNIFDIIKLMTKDLVKDDFRNIETKQRLTYGEKLYLEHSFAGIRQEAQLGYPNIIKNILPRLIQLKEENLTKRQIYLELLFRIMSKADDSNIIARGGFKSLEYVKLVAANFLNDGGVYVDNYLDNIEAINQQFKEKNLSPGGSADLLSAVIFIDYILDQPKVVIKK